MNNHLSAAMTNDTISQIAAIEFPGKSITDPVLVGRGIVSHVYKIEVDGRPLAVKLHPCDRATVSDFEREEYDRESHWLVHAAAAGIPCPETLAHGWIGNVAYSVQSFITGVSGEDESIQPDFIWEELGKLARLVHTIPVENAEEKWRNYREWIVAGLTQDDIKIAIGLYRPDQQAGIRKIFERLGEIDFQYGLCHGDLHPRNTVVDRRGQVYLLDWGATSRDINLVPHGDLGDILWNMEPDDDRFRAFCTGYGISEREFEKIRIEVLAVSLIGNFWFDENPPQTEFGHLLIKRVREILTRDWDALLTWVDG